MASLARGVPLVCIPQGRDQGLNAQRVTECGVGVCVSADATPEIIAGAIRHVLGDGGYLARARSMSELIAQTGAGHAAVQQLESLLL